MVDVEPYHLRCVRNAAGEDYLLYLLGRGPYMGKKRDYRSIFWKENPEIFGYDMIFAPYTV